MPNPLNETNIIAPRVPLIDERSGLISREWYRFFLNLFVLTGGGRNDTSLLDLQVGPPTQPQLDLHNINPEPAGLAAYAAGSAQESQIAELQKQIQALALDNCCAATISELAQVQKQLQAFAVTPQSQLGTMAALQQDNVPYLVMDTSPTPPPVPPVPGAMWWNTSGTLNVKMGNNNITQQVGEEFFQYGKASAAISDVNLQLVYKTGVVGASGVITFAPTIAGIADTDLIIGIATEPLALNAFGRVTTLGTVNAINTSGSVYGEVWADNDDIWYNPVTGGLTKIKPVAPNVKLQVGTIINAGPGGSGSFSVKIAGSSILGGTDANVQFGTLVNGDSLVYDTTLGYWVNRQASALSGAPITKTADFTVAAGETWFINNKSGSTCVVTLPVASSWTGRTLTFKNMQAQLLNSASSNVVPIDSTSAGTAILLNVIGNWATMVSDGTNWVIMQQAPNNILLLE
jgi:hypothetical protein